MKRFGVILAVLFLVGCDNDMAKMYLQQCKDFEAQGEFKKAFDSCSLASSLASDSKSGKAAWERVPMLSDKVEAQKKADEAKAAQEAASKVVACTVGWVTLCAEGGAQKYEGFKTKPKCDEFVTSMADMVKCLGCRCASEVPGGELAVPKG